MQRALPPMHGHRQIKRCSGKQHSFIRFTFLPGFILTMRLSNPKKLGGSRFLHEHWGRIVVPVAD